MTSQESLLLLNKLSKEELLLFILLLCFEHLPLIPIEEKTSPARQLNDSISNKHDYYSSVTEKYFFDYGNLRFVEWKRIGINGLDDINWIGFLAKDQPESWHELRQVGFWKK